MKFQDKHIVVTGGAGGIGAALCRRFVSLGAKVVVADLNEAAAQELALELGATGLACDVSQEAGIQGLITAAEKLNGPIDIFVSNAGFASGDVDHAASASNEIWQRNWDVHVMSHVYAARALLPAMLARGDGYFVNVASAAGLLSQVGDAAYTATKHAAVAFAESLSISHGDQGIKVSVVCPQYVATNILGVMGGPQAAQSMPGVISAGDCADIIVQGIQDEKFMILPHQEVAEFGLRRAGDVDRWLTGMRRYRAALLDEDGKLNLANMFNS